MSISPSIHLNLGPDFVIPGVLGLTASSPYWLGMTMFRLQEFYESPYACLRGQVFSFETAMDIYANTDGTFKYAENWAGFNVPGEIVDEFFLRFRGLLGAKETYLHELIQRHRPSGNYYLIGTCEQAGPGFLEHELAHAAFYLDPIYKKTMMELANKIPVRALNAITEWILGEGYHQGVLTDEIQAYLSTNNKKENREMFKIAPKIAAPFCKYYTEYFEKRRLDMGRVHI